MSAILLRPGAARVGAVCPLDVEETHHVRVRRIQPGEMVDLRDGRGLVGRGRLLRDGDTWSVEVNEAGQAPQPAELVIAVGAGDRDRFAWLVEKASELGVTSVIPLETSRAVAVATRLRGRHLDKLRRQGLEAIKQSGAAWAVAIEEPVTLDRFLGAGRTGTRWLADAEGAVPEALLGSDAVSVIVGPEGGLTGPEREAAVAAGYHPVRLGAHTLRFETAAVAAAAAVSAARLRGTDG